MASLYFEPYTESEDAMDSELLGAIRTQNREKVRAALESKGSNEIVRNQFGETVTHLVCRYTDSPDFLRYVCSELRQPLNVRDCYGRTPLHNVCMSYRPNLHMMDYILTEAPELLLYGDDSTDRLPLEFVRASSHPRCIEMLEETKPTWVVQLLSRKEVEYL
jgi:hypothetical protein